MTHNDIRKKSHSNEYLLKSNFEKAYNMINWDYLLEVLRSGVLGVNGFQGSLLGSSQPKSKSWLMEKQGKGSFVGEGCAKKTSCLLYFSSWSQTN